MTMAASPPGTTLTVGIADAKVSADAGASLVTHALGSCVGVTAYDRKRKIGGLLHILLPESSLDAAEAERNPYKYADTGIRRLFEELARAGAERRGLEVRLIGGAQMLNDQGLFNIGHRNVLAARKLLWKMGCFLKGEETGGAESRTVRLEIGTGDVYIRRQGRPEEKLR